MEFDIIMPEHDEYVEIGMEDVAEASVATLHKWFKELNQNASDLAEFVAAFRLAQIDDEKYYRRTAGKIAYLKIAAKWIERRLLELGEKPRYSPTDPRCREIRILQDKLEKLNKAKPAA